MEQNLKIIQDSPSAVLKKNKKPKVFENVKKVKERIIHSNTLLQLYKGKEKEMEQYTADLASLKEKLSKSDFQLSVLNKESEIFRQAAQQYKKEATDLKQQLEEKKTQLKNQKLLDNDIQRLRRENDAFSKKIQVLETLKGQLERKVNENKIAKVLSENQGQKIMKLKKDLEIKDEEIKSNQSVIDTIKDELESLRNSEEELQDKILERDFRIAIMDESITEKTSTIAELNRQLDITQATFIKGKLMDFITEPNGSMCLMPFLQQNFTLEKFDVLVNILDEVICGLDTPIYLNIGSNIIDDEIKSYARKSFQKNLNDIKLPIILPDKEKYIILFLTYLISEEHKDEFFEKILFWVSDKIISYNENLNLKYISRLCRLFVAICRTLNEIQRVRILCYDICREKTNNSFVLSILVNTATIWPFTLKMPNNFDYDVIESLKKGQSIFLRIFECIAVDCIKEIKGSNASKLEKTFIRLCSWNRTHEVPSLQEIFDNLINFVSLPKFHEFCNQLNNMDNIGKFNIFHFNLLKSIELISFRLQWDNIYENTIIKVLCPLFEDERGLSIPLEIIGVMCCSNLCFDKDKKGVSIIQQKLKRVLNSPSQMSLYTQSICAKILMKLNNGQSTNDIEAVLSWHLQLDQEQKSYIPKPIAKDIEYLINTRIQQN